MTGPADTHVARPVPRLMLVTDRRSTSVPLQILATHAIAGGAEAIQLREKDLPSAARAELAADLLAVMPPNVRLLVNGDVQLAACLGCGVHLPEEGLPISLARQAVGDAALVGRSVHSPEAALASAGADYLLAGNVFETRSKPGRAGTGISGLREIVQAASVPVLAIGGINETNASEVLRAGAYGIAVISAISSAPHPQAAARRLRDIIERSSAVTMEETEQTPIVVNGKDDRVRPGTTVSGFLASKGFQDRLVVVERNGTILGRDIYASTTLETNDRLEIVHFVGGG